MSETRTDRAQDLPIAAAIAFMRNLRKALESGAELPVAMSHAASGLPRQARTRVERLTERLGGDYSEDEWGFDEEFAESAFPFFEFMFDRWWRVQVDGVQHVPGHGRALLVANHAGVVPWDATMIGVAILRNHPLPRYARFLVLNWAFDLPYASVFLRKVGGVARIASQRPAAARAGEPGGRVPRGREGSRKGLEPALSPSALRPRGLHRAGPANRRRRSCPSRWWGARRSTPSSARTSCSRASPAPPTSRLPRPSRGSARSGGIPLPSKWRIEFCEPIPTEHYGPERAQDQRLVLELSEQVQETIQQKLYENLVKRGATSFSSVRWASSPRRSSGRSWIRSSA